MLEKTPLFAESWNVAWRRCSSGSVIEDKKTPFFIIRNSCRYWAADPFLFSHDGEYYVFAELYDYIARKGVIGYCKWNGKRFGHWKAVIKEKYHLSYPFIFEHDGGIYIMPESGANQSLQLYRAVSFPDKWEKVRTLRENVVYGDTTPFCYEQHTFGLTYDLEKTHEPKLALLDFENDKNDRIVNVDNIDLRRPAGKYFIYNDALVRPAQNCRGDYGKGLLFYRCYVNNGEYSERLVAEVLPQELSYSRRIYLDGMHTYNADEHFEVIDIKTRRFNLLNLVSRIIGKLR